MGNQSFSRRIIVYISLFIFIILAGATGFQIFDKLQDNQYEHNTNKLLEKEKTVTDLWQAYNLVFFEARGYMAFQKEEHMEHVDQEYQVINEHIQKLEKFAENNSDKQFLSQVEQFNTFYFNNFLPEIVAQVKSGNENEIRGLVEKNHSTEKLSEFQTILDEYQYEVANHFQNQIALHSKIETKSTWAFTFFLFFMLAAFLFMSRKMIVKIARPIKNLAEIANDVSIGKEINIIKETERLDEIGILARSLEQMLKSIKHNEQSLIAQNEELIAQQDELQSQQIELQVALKYKDVYQENLKRKHDLIHSLSTTLNRQELLDSVVENMVRIFNANKGIIVLLDYKDTAALGISKQGQEQFIQNLDESFLVRLMQGKKAYMIERESTDVEKGYHDEKIFSYDIVIPIFSTDEEIVSLMVYTRIGIPFTDEELQEIAGVAKEISLSFDKLKAYEEAHNQRTLTKEILDTIREGVQFVDEKGYITQTNYQLCKMLHIDNVDDTIPITAWLAGIPEQMNNIESLREFMRKAIYEEGVTERSILYEMNNPEIQMIKLYFEPLYRNNRRIGTVFVHQDITKEYEINQMKSEFVSTVSHELRTPLASILGFSEVMLKKQVSPERQKKYMTTIYQEAKRLTALINDFLDVQRMEAGRQTYEKKYCKLLPIISKVMDAQKINNTLHQFEINQETNNAVILGDSDKLYQVFNNLINNAVKYSPDGGKVTVTLREQDSRLHVAVKDEGLGIPEEALPNLFTKFYRVDNSDRRKIGGTGLGLSIVKEIVKVHDGDITVQSKLKSGSTFSLSFPLVKLPEFENEPGLGEQENYQGKIIIIEDDSNLALLIQNELKEIGFHVIRYDNGEKAIQELKSMEEPPATIIVDIMLGEGMDGWEIISNIKKDNRLKQIPILISSALEEKERSKKLGVSDYLVKPYEPTKLSKVVLQTLLEKEKTGQILFPVENKKQ